MNAIVEPGLKLSGEYVRCERLKATMLRSACVLNKEGCGKIKRKETCIGCEGATTVVDSTAVGTEPSVEHLGYQRLGKAYLAQREKPSVRTPTRSSTRISLGE